MDTRTKKKITLMMDAEVYEGLQQKVGVRKVGDYLSELARPFVRTTDIAASYKELAADTAQASEAKEWERAVEAPIEAENVWHL